MNLVPLDLDRDLELLHAWVTHPRSHFWGLQGADPQRVRAEYERIAADPHHHAWLGLDDDGTPLFWPRPTTRRTASWPSTTRCAPATSVCTCWSPRRPGSAPGSPPR